MKKLAISILTLVLFTVSCKKQETTETPKQEQNSENVFNGMYSGEISNNFMDSFVTITFNKNGSVTKATYENDSDGTSNNETGTWIKTDTIIEVKIGKLPTEFYKIKTNNSIVLLDAKKKEFSEKPNKTYLLSKTEAYATNVINGTYQTQIDGKDYNQILNLEAINDSIYKVNISFTGATKGCNFEGKGQLINNQIDVKLNQIDPKLKATMTIQFKDNNKIAEVFTSKFDQRFDLMSFCGGGASLAGDYTKK